MTQVIIGEQVAGESAAIRRQLESLVKHYDKSLFDIGDLLYQVRHNGFYKSWGYNTFKEYVETLNFKERRAQYLTRIVDVMSQVGIPRTQYEALGITKLREITQLDPNGTWTNPKTGFVEPLKDWIAALVADGANMSADDIKLHVRTLRGMVGDDDLVWENFYITRLVKNNIVEPAKELARRNIGSVGKDEDGESKDASNGACLEIWCTEFLNDPANNVLAENYDR